MTTYTYSGRYAAHYAGRVITIADCAQIVMTAEYDGREFSAEGTFNSAWEQIAKQLPAGKRGDIVHLTIDGSWHAGSLRWEVDLCVSGGGYWRYSPE